MTEVGSTRPGFSRTRFVQWLCRARCSRSALLPSAAHAQSSIAGVVRDASGAVLPGVTVEAASPALIEKVRTAVSDGTGQYRLENLRPGTYTLTLLAHRLFAGEARERRSERRRHPLDQRRPARRRRAGDDHRERRDAGRGRADQHEEADRARRLRHRVAALVARLRQPALGRARHPEQPASTTAPTRA